MLKKTRKFRHVVRLTASNRAPIRRARQFLINIIRIMRAEVPSASMRTALGLTSWETIKQHHTDDLGSMHSVCFLTGRCRGTSQRHTVARTKVKWLTSCGLLIGLRKASF